MPCQLQQPLVPLMPSMPPLWTWEGGLRKALGLGQSGPFTGWYQTGLFFGSSFRLFLVISNLEPSALEGPYSIN